jgi:hypothetical protein
MKNLKAISLAALISVSSVNVYATSADQVIITPKEYSALENFNMKVTEQIYNPASGENTPWVHTPTKMISMPIAKFQYEIVQFATSLVTESVRRSPWHNALGTLDEAKKTLMLIKNGLFDMLRGVLNPKNGAFIDGAMGVANGVVNTVNVAGGVVKTGASLVAYPIYRVAGGGASERASLPGKRAAIIQIDTGMYPLDVVLDPYGDQIIRHHLNGVVDYYCVTSEVEGSLKDCIKNIPYDIDYVDFVALTHSGGTRSNESAAEKVLDKGHKVGMMVSIGCYDDDSKMTLKENTFGQKGLSWAVHFYLSHAIAKRLRGIPMDVAAKEAFYEDLPVNMINPVSLLGQLGVWGMGEDSGIFGSDPDVRNQDSDEILANIEEQNNYANAIRVMKYAKLYNEGLISINEFGKLVDHLKVDKDEVLATANDFINYKKDAYSGRCYDDNPLFCQSNLRDEFEALADNFEKTRLPVKVKIRKRRPGSKIPRTIIKYI